MAEHALDLRERSEHGSGERRRRDTHPGGPAAGVTWAMLSLMPMPFEKLLELVAALDDEELDLPMGELARRWDETTRRVAYALDALRKLGG